MLFGLFMICWHNIHACSQTTHKHARTLTHLRAQTSYKYQTVTDINTKTLCINSCTHAHTNINNRTHSHTHTRTHTHNHTHTQSHTHIHTITHIYSVTHTRTHTRTHICANIYRHKFTHIYACVKRRSEMN